MKHVDSDTYNIAWFKLADCIARGEKERALGVYRLLSHSLDDSALAVQLLADILRSFQDPQAIAKYKEAAGMYRANNQLLEAAAVYEHLTTIEPDSVSFRKEMIELYQQLNIRSKVTHYVEKLVRSFLHNDDWKHAVELVMAHEASGTPEFGAKLHELVLFYLVMSQEVLPETKVVHAKKALDAWSAAQDDEAVATLLSRLEAADTLVAKHAKQYWQEISK